MPRIPSAARELAELRSRIWWRDVRLSKSQGTLIPRYEVHSIYCKIKDGGDKKVQSMYNQQRLNFECHSTCKEEPLVCSNYGHLVDFSCIICSFGCCLRRPSSNVRSCGERCFAQQGVRNKGTTTAGQSPFPPLFSFLDV